MFITKKHIPRRTFLRGIGAAVALPLLDSMIPASTVLAQTAASPKLRMGFIYFPHGAIMDQWTPKTDGKDFQISPILQPLEPYQEAVDDCERAGQQAGNLASRACVESGNLAQLRIASQDAGAICGNHRRPTRGPTSGAGHTVSVTRGRDRIQRRKRHLRPQLRMQLFRHHFVP